MAVVGGGSRKHGPLPARSSRAGSEDDAVCVSYWLNLLQRLPRGAPDLFCTLNPPHPPAPGTVLRQLTLAHPAFSARSDAAQALLPAVQVPAPAPRTLATATCVCRGGRCGLLRFSCT